MVAVEPEPTQGAPSETLIEQVKDALENLYDLGYLRRHPLAQKYEAKDAGQRLRWELVGAIEALSPGPSVPFHAPQARLHNLLVLHYVECRTVQEAAHTIDISRRQAHRDLRQGVARVAEILQANRSASTEQEPNVSQLSSVETEVARLTHHPHPTDLHVLLQRAQATLQSLARQRDVRFQVQAPNHPAIVSADPAIAEQVLVNVLSSAIQQTRAGTIHLAIANNEEQTSLSLHYLPEPGAAAGSAMNPVVAQFADQLGWTMQQKSRPDGERTVTLHLPACGPRVLVIDDNEGLVKLVGRYLTDQACRVVAATNGQEGLELARELVPDAIVLDVMIPGMHGWEVLQRLRTSPQTARVPVIICSVINDPGLAYSLGASLFLPKPLSRDGILQALRQLDVLG